MTNSEARKRHDERIATMQHTTFTNIPVGGRFHFSKSSGLLSDVGKVDTTKTYIKRSARTYYNEAEHSTHLRVGNVHAICWKAAASD